MTREGSEWYLIPATLIASNKAYQASSRSSSKSGTLALICLVSSSLSIVKG